MKRLMILFSLLVLVLACLPCPDAFEKKACAATEQGDRHSHKDDQAGDDSCSPFCSCTCCAGFSINYPFLSIVTVPVYRHYTYASYLPGSLFHYTSAVWQPPKLG